MAETQPNEKTVESQKSQPVKKPPFFSKDWWVLQLKELGPLIVVIVIIRSSLASTYQVPTGSMIPSLLPGDRFFAFQAAYGLRVPLTEIFLSGPKSPHKGDIMVFISPRQPDINLVKRVVATEGDVIEVQDGKVVLNGKPVPIEPISGAADDGYEHYFQTIDGVKHQIQFDKSMPQLRYMPPVKIEPGYFFAMGDNRDHSGDSRVFGPVDVHALRGKAERFFFSLDWDGGFPFFRMFRFFASMYPY